MDRVEYSGKGVDAAKKTGEVESLGSARQASRIADIIAAAKAKLEDEAEVVLMIPAAPEPQQQPSGRQYPRRQRMLTVSTRILVIVTVILALFVFTSPLHLGRYSGVRYWAEIILGVSYIALGMSVIAFCVLIKRPKLLAADREIAEIIDQEGDIALKGGPWPTESWDSPDLGGASPTP